MRPAGAGTSARRGAAGVRASAFATGYRSLRPVSRNQFHFQRRREYPAARRGDCAFSEIPARDGAGVRVYRADAGRVRAVRNRERVPGGGLRGCVGTCVSPDADSTLRHAGGRAGHLRQGSHAVEPLLFCDRFAAVHAGGDFATPGQIAVPRHAGFDCRLLRRGESGTGRRRIPGLHSGRFRQSEQRRSGQRHSACSCPPFSRFAGRLDCGA